MIELWRRAKLAVQLERLVRDRGAVCLVSELVADMRWTAENARAAEDLHAARVLEAYASALESAPSDGSIGVTYLVL